MTTTLHEKTKKMLASHDYIVIAEQIEDRLKVTFPHAKFIKPYKEREIINYKLQRSKASGIIVNEEFWSAPEYSLRLMITCDIVNRMKRLPIHESLISYYNRDGFEVNRLADLLEGPEGAEDKKKEGFLVGLLTKAIEDKFPIEYEDVANTPEHNVGTGYRLLKSFF